ncbi:MAG: ribonucleoside diphosphate reductase large subunit [Barrevirus sp.]|uniref:Ribonucleoside-diphosphate reductase n=1 Tax=Barrevirus sp. TaxID=2487763 RepID=A0A3G4ZPN9_9VIRU|nr:MAG: ribonucleoside diphosphate reductase large subunit [Barrevirus sp.]
MESVDNPCTITKFKMSVRKRDGRIEDISLDKIGRRIQILCTKLNLDRIDTLELLKETVKGLSNGITTEEIDHFTAVKCAERIKEDPQYDDLAAALCISRLHKMTSPDFLEVTTKLLSNRDKKGELNPLVTDEYVNSVKKNIDVIQKVLEENYHLDYRFDYFGYKTLERAYLHRIKESIDQTSNTAKKDATLVKEGKLKDIYGKIIERPQHLFMRVAIALNLNNIDRVIEVYRAMAEGKMIFGSPTLYNAGNKWQQMSSCFLLKMGDSLESILETITNAGLISKRAGGIGISISDVRASGSYIRGTNGTSSGVIPMIQVFNWLGRYINQGGRRNGAIAIYLEPWHADIFHFCELRSNKGKEEERARDIFLALWVCDLFMRRVENNELWSLMCPDECPGLTTTFGEEFEKLYLQYEAEGRYKKQVRAADLWYHILVQQIETGMPYILFKDAVNRQTNQSNLGTIQCSNLCSEIAQYTSDDEIAICNLSSICLPRFIVKDQTGKLSYDFKQLEYIAGLATYNLNNVIDVNYYPVEKGKRSNLKHRPIGIGVQGLADVYCLLGLPFDSEEARILNRKIFETIYYGALKMSNDLAKEFGAYETFWYNGGCPFSKGQLQFHLWGLKTEDLLMDLPWQILIDDIKKFGTRNSLLTTVMPTASTSQIMGNSEYTEPITSNVYIRTTLAGEFLVVNRHLVETLISLGLWTEQVRNEITYDNGSIQNIDIIPDHIKKLYRTAVELKNKPIVQQSVERGPFIDQSQSLNLFCKVPDFNMLTSSHFYAFRNKAKTGMYYLKTQPAVDAIKFGIDSEVIEKIEAKRKGQNPDKIIVDKKIEEEIVENTDPRRQSEIELNHGSRPSTSKFNCDACSS